MLKTSALLAVAALAAVAQPALAQAGSGTADSTGQPLRAARRGGRTATGLSERGFAAHADGSALRRLIFLAQRPRISGAFLFAGLNLGRAGCT